MISRVRATSGLTSRVTVPGRSGTSVKGKFANDPSASLEWADFVPVEALLAGCGKNRFGTAELRWLARLE